MDNCNSFCVYNLDRGVSLNSKVSIADCANQPLKILKIIVSGIALNAESGLWLKPLYGAPAVPRIFPFDLLYLDGNQRVLEALEVFPEVELPACPPEAESALLLPQKILHVTGTARGDRLLVCQAEEMHRELSLIRGSQSEAVGLAGVSVAGRQPDLSKRLAIPPEVLSSLVGDQGSSQQKNGSKIPVTKKPSKREEERETPPRLIDADETAKTPTIAITEVFIEKPAGGSPLRPPVNHDPGDLFGNWVDSPATPPAWIEHQAHADAHLSEPSPVSSANESSQPGGATSTLEKGPARETSGAAKASVDPGNATASHAQLQPDLVPKQADQKEVDARREYATNLGTRKPSVPVPVPGQAPKAAPTGTPQPSSTFTVAQFGMWHVSLPTAVGPGVTRMGQESVKPGSVASQKVPPLVQPPATGAARATETKPETVLKSGALPANQGAQLPSLSTRRDAAGTAALNPSPSVAAVENTTLKTVQNDPKTQGDLPSNNGQNKPISARLDPLRNATKTADANAPGADQNAAKRSENEGAGKKSPEIVAAAALPGLPQPDAKSKVPIQPAGIIGNNGDDSHSLKARFKRWLNPVTLVSDRRRAQRRYVPGVIAHYYTGGAPKPHEVADVSMTGFYMLTEDRWMPGTMIQMTLQKPCAKGERKQSITVLSRIVRRGSDGVGAEFVMPESIDSRSADVQPAQVTDRFALARFL